ncbi:MAG: ABC transporter ATP-binding protein [Bacteroidales bacterium]
MQLLKATSIHKSFDNLQVLKGIDLSILQGEVVSIVGASGAGKTTLLQIIGTLLKPDNGTVEINGVNVVELSEKELASFRNRELGFIFQFHNLLPEFSALENTMIPALIQKISKTEAEERAKEMLDYLGLSQRLSHRPNELSGGERQRVAAARALINKPKVIFADEPSGNLDSQNRKELHDLIFELRNKFGQSFVIVTHDESFSHESDRILRVKDGLIT